MYNKYSPRSLSALNSLGIDQKNLYFTNKIDFISYNPKIKSQTNRYKNRCFFNKEINRNKLICRSQSERNIILNEKNNMVEKEPFINNINNSSANYSYNGKKIIRNFGFSPYIEKNKSITDYWALRYDKDKENQRFFLIEKQNLAEVKQLIDQTVKLYNKARENIYDGYIKNEEKKNKLKLEYQKQKDKDYYNKEIINKEIDLMDKKRKENEFNKFYLKQKKIDEEKEQGIINEQNYLLKRQKEWEMKNKEHMSKVDSIYQQKHNLVLNEYNDILKNDIKRQKKRQILKESFNNKNKIKNEKRTMYLLNYKRNKKIMETNVRKKFDKKQKDISLFYEEQKEIKNNLIKSQQSERNKKKEKTIFLKHLNEELKKERRDRLLEQFKINEEKVENRKNFNEKKNEDMKFNNYIKHDRISANYLEKKNILINKNLIKKNNMINKDIAIQEKIKRRQLSARLKMRRDNFLKLKKQQMINQVNEILDERKEHKIEEVYKRIFTDEEMKLLRENENN